MISNKILDGIGEFSASESDLFKKVTFRRTLKKNEPILREGEICQSLCYVLSGSFIQFQKKDANEQIIDLHTEQEWVFNAQSLMAKTPSNTTIKAFENSEVLELSLTNLHHLIAQSQSFLQLASILNLSHNRAHIFDNSFSPVERYDYIKKVKPQVVKVFPVKVIASYLKIAPETLSRVRAKR